MTVGWVYSRRFLDHDTGNVHPECPQRLQAIVEALEDAGLLERMQAIPFRQASTAELALVHDPAYVDVVRLMCDEGFTFIGSSDTCICPKSYDVAATAIGAVLAACDAVVAGKVERAFCAVRPPGHHAETDQALGFCIFNNVATGAEHLVRKHGLSRVAIVDFDVHHGNGTQHIFQSRRDVFYISIHERPGSLEFPGTGNFEETGLGPGRGFTLNVPLSWGSRESEYRSALENHVLPALDRYQPEFLLLSAGFDALAGDAISHVSLKPESFGWITQALVQAAQRYARGRLVSVLEGGYDLGTLGRAATAHVRALLAS